ncbi:MAG: DUF4465 domain-containing protein [Bacteroidia bacterium]
MKKIYINILTLCAFAFIQKINAQTISTFENITLAADTFKNGSDRLGGFTSGNAFFVNHYDSAFQSWDGFAVSDKRDTSTASYRNQYASETDSGYRSANYAVGYYNGFSPVIIKLNAPAKGKQLTGFYITNSTYAYLAMKNGSSFNKKFGGVSGNDPDWFKITINGFRNGGNPADTAIDFYLADFRFTDNSKDYFVKTWTWLDLTKMGNVDSIEIVMSSTDTAGGFGMNNPAYFCLDNFTTLNAFAGTGEINSLKNEWTIFPNPAKNEVTIHGFQGEGSLLIVDITGKEMLQTETNGLEKKISLENFSKGIYFIQIRNAHSIQTKKLIIE